MIEHLQRIGASCCALTGLALVLRATTTFPGKKEEALTWAVKCATLVHHGILGVVALGVLFAEYGDDLYDVATSQKAEGAAALADLHSPTVSILTDFSVGYMVFDLIFISTWSSGEYALMLMHHALSMGLWPISSFAGWGQGWVIWFIAMEISSLFMAVRWMILSAGGKGSSTEKLNGLLFLVSFFIIRIVPIPVYFLAFYLQGQPTSTAHLIAQGMEPAQAESMLALGKWIGLACLLPSVLNMFWFYKIVNMVMKMGKSDKAKKSE